MMAQGIGGRLTKSNEELGVVRVLLAVIGHSNQPSMHKSKSRMDFIFELVAIERLPTSPSSCPVSGLDQEVWNHSVENHIVIVA